VINGRKRQIEGPFGVCTGHYSGGRRMPVVRIPRLPPHEPRLRVPLLRHALDGVRLPRRSRHLRPLLKQLRAEFPRSGPSTPCTPTGCWPSSPPGNATAVSPRRSRCAP
jgi:hypothetical protein